MSKPSTQVTKATTATAAPISKLMIGVITVGILALLAVGGVKAWYNTVPSTSSNTTARSTAHNTDKQAAGNGSQTATSGDDQVAVIAGSQAGNGTGTVLGASTTQPNNTGSSVNTAAANNGTVAVTANSSQAAPATSNDAQSTGSQTSTGQTGQGGMGGGSTNGGDTNQNPSGGNTGGNGGSTAPTQPTQPTPTNPAPQGNGFVGGRVSLTFDDGVSTIYANALPLLHAYNFKSTQYLISQTLKDNANYPGYFTADQAREFYSADKGVPGTELADHTMYHCSLIVTTITDDADNCKTNLSASQQAAQNQRELSQSKIDLRAMFPGYDFNDIASPYGSYDLSAINEMKANGYVSHRSTDAGFNTYGKVDPYNIVVQNVEKATTVAQVNAWVDEAAANNEWLVLVYHDVAATGQAGDYGVTKADLDAELKYIQGKQTAGLQVVTVSEALAEAAKGGFISTPETGGTAARDTPADDQTAADDGTVASDQPADTTDSSDQSN